MNKVIKILIAEHDKNDLQILEHELIKGGINHVSRIIQTEEDFTEAIIHFVPDIILSDYTFPSFDGPTAFKIREQLAPLTPFILVSGTVGEETVVELIKSGVTDYALKDKLFTLPNKINRALRDSEKAKQVIKDITERQRGERNLIQSEERLREAQTISHISNWEIDLITGVNTWSDEFYNILRIKREDITPSPEAFLSLLHPDDYDFVKNIIERTFETHTEGSFNSRTKEKDGTSRQIFSQWKFEFDKNNKPIRLFGILQDITERKLSEENLILSELRMNEAQALARIGNWDTNFATGESMWSLEACRIYGLPLTETTQSYAVWESFIHPEDLADVLELNKNASNILSDTTLNYRIILKDGTIKHIFAKSRFKLASNGKPIGLSGIIQDVTENVLAEKEREKMMGDIIQRSKNLEQFTYIISHNLRAPIANILGIANVLKGNVTDEDRSRIQQFLFIAVEKLDDTVKDLNKILQIRSEITESKESVDLSELVQVIRSSIQNLIQKENAQILTDFSFINKLTTIKSYVHSIFYNLIANAIKYKHPDKAPIIRIKSYSHNNKTFISFKDNGTGIDLEQHGDKVFGLYKRFHENIEGKGLGLFMVKTQVEVLGGSISVKSELGVGTEFTIEFPK